MTIFFRHIPRQSRFRSVLGLILLGLLVIGVHLIPSSANAATSLETALKKIPAGDMVPGADRYGQPEGDPAFVRVWRGDELAGYVFMNTDVASAIGYSGKPIHVLIGLSTEGLITRALLYRHSEPIVLIGIPEKKITAYMDRYIGLSVLEIEAITRSDSTRTIDMISGATVTIMVIDDSITRSALKMARALGLAGLAPLAAGQQPVSRGEINLDHDTTEDWINLVGDGSVRRMRLSVGDVTEAFAAAGRTKAAAQAESDDPNAEFIDLYIALASVPTIGRTLLGDAEYTLLRDRLAPGQQAIAVIGAGLYSFKGSGYVRGGIFDRIQLIQSDQTIRFRDRNHKHIGEIEAEHARAFKEIALFVIPDSASFDGTRPFRLDLLVNRAIGALEKDFLTFSIDYLLPERYLALPPVAASGPSTALASGAGNAAEIEDAYPLWRRIWDQRTVDLAVLAAALTVLTGIFFFQNWFARRPRLASIVRTLFLIFTVAWIGGYAQAQLSVVNVFTFAGAMMHDFKWDYFLMDPLIFILWISVATSLLFWGRGPFCGWLCPFGAAQELLNKLARLAHLPQWTLPWGLHERLWPVKYVIFIGLFGMSLYSLAFAEQLAEIEPFKTSVILRFAREWPFVLYAIAMLSIGLFVERFFCRYLCPLGAALAIPGKLRIFEWLRRHKECASPCQRCAKECMVQAIHPNGKIDANECLYCMNCQVLYWHDHKCPPMIQRRLRSERRREKASRILSTPTAAPQNATASATGPIEPVKPTVADTGPHS